MGMGMMRGRSGKHGYGHGHGHSSKSKSKSGNGVLVPCMLLLIFVTTAALLLLAGSRSSSSSLRSTGISKTQLGSTHLQAYVTRTLRRAMHSEPLKVKAEVLFKEAYANIALSNAYASYARNAKLEMGKQVQVFIQQVDILSKLLNQPEIRAFRELSSSIRVDEDQVRIFERDVKERIKEAKVLMMENKENFDSQMKIQKLEDTIFAVSDQLTRATKQGSFASLIAAKSIPKSLHCLSTRLMEERISNPSKYDIEDARAPELEDPKLYHYAIFSENVLAVSVVVNSVVRNARAPEKHVFHVVTDKMSLWPMKVWFTMRPLSGAHIEVKAMDDYAFLKPSYVPVLRQLEVSAKLHKPQNLSMLNHLRFYLADMFPKLHKVMFLDDDVVVQKDLTELWSVNMDGKVVAAVETCFGSFHRYSSYVNFSHPLVKERLDPMACAWAFGVNLFDLDAWKREKSTEKYHFWQDLNENRTLWKLGTLPPGLITFYKAMKPLDKSWHVLGLGYNPNISSEKIKNAAVIHFNGNMKPWLDIALHQYKDHWTKYVDYGMVFLQMCNFGH